MHVQTDQKTIKLLNRTTDYFEILIVIIDLTLPLCVMNKRKQPHAKVYDLDAGDNVS